MDVIRVPLRAGRSFRPLNDNGREYISGAFLGFPKARPFEGRGKVVDLRQGGAAKRHPGVRLLPAAHEKSISWQPERILLNLIRAGFR